MTKPIQVALHCVPVPRLWVCSRCARKPDQSGVEQLGHRARFWFEDCPRCEKPGVGMLFVPATPDEIQAARAQEARP